MFIVSNTSISKKINEKPEHYVSETSIITAESVEPSTIKTESVKPSIIKTESVPRGKVSSEASVRTPLRVTPNATTWVTLGVEAYAKAVATAALAEFCLMAAIKAS